MRTKLYLGVGVFAALAAVVAFTGRGFAEQDANQPVTEQQNVNQHAVGEDHQPTDQHQTTDPLQTRETRGYRGEVTTDQGRTHGQHAAFKASELLGLNIRGRDSDDDIGEISDLMIQRDGKVSYAAVSFGGFLGLGDKMFAVPFEAIEIVKTDDEGLHARMDVTEEKLQNMEGFNQDNWPNEPNRQFGAHLGQRQAERPDTDVDVDVQR